MTEHETKKMAEVWRKNSLRKNETWNPIHTAPKQIRNLTLKQDGVEYKGFEWFEGSWAKVVCDQVGPYVIARLTHPSHWKLH